MWDSERFRRLWSTTTSPWQHHADLRIWARSTTRFDRKNDIEKAELRAGAPILGRSQSHVHKDARSSQFSTLWRQRKYPSTNHHEHLGAPHGRGTVLTSSELGEADIVSVLASDERSKRPAAGAEIARSRHFRPWQANWGLSHRPAALSGWVRFGLSPTLCR
jgi:hypothetical protein